MIGRLALRTRRRPVTSIILQNVWYREKADAGGGSHYLEAFPMDAALSGVTRERGLIASTMADPGIRQVGRTVSDAGSYLL